MISLCNNKAFDNDAYTSTTRCASNICFWAQAWSMERRDGIRSDKACRLESIVCFLAGNIAFTGASFLIS
jgi:hypothetical protein